MLLFLTTLILVNSQPQIRGTRTILSDYPAEGQLLVVQYKFYNDGTENVDNFVMLDPSFTKSNVKFLQMRSHARLTFGTIPAGESSYVNLQMIPLHPGKLKLQQAQIQYVIQDEKLRQTVFEKDKLELIPKHQYQLQFTQNNEQWAIVSLWLVFLGVLPYVYSYFLYFKRLKVLKTKID